MPSILIDDNNYRDFARSDTNGGFECAATMDDPGDLIACDVRLRLPTYTRTEKLELIKERQAKRATLRHMIRAKKMPVKKQARTNYCWSYAIARLIEVQQAYQDRMADYVPLSAAGPAAIIKRGANVGGNPQLAMNFAVEHGYPRLSDWQPEHDLNYRKHDTPALRQKMAENRVLGWQQLEYGNLDQLDACLLNNRPVAVFPPWWRHIVVFVDVLSGKYDFDNSWGLGYGDQGAGFMTPSRAQGHMWTIITASDRND